MNIDNLFKDKEWYETKNKPSLDSFTIDSNGEKMLSFMLSAGGNGLHPTVVLLHGLPGNERNFDIGHALRRAGCNVLFFHYRGAWGSYGNFTLKHAIEDVKAVLKYLRRHEILEKYNIDDSNIFLLGHSMGGFAALNTTVHDFMIKGTILLAPFDFGLAYESSNDNCKANDILGDLIETASIWYKGFSLSDCLNELKANANQWKFSSMAEILSKKNILFVGASLDDIASVGVHIEPLLDDIDQYDNAGEIDYVLMNTDHSFQDMRITLTELIAEWIRKIIDKK